MAHKPQTTYIARAIHTDGGPVFTGIYADEAGQQKFIDDNPKRNIYRNIGVFHFGDAIPYISPGQYVSAGIGKVPKAQLLPDEECLTHVQFLYIDIDFKDGVYANVREALKAAQDVVFAGKMPQFTHHVSTGHGLHLYWRTNLPMTVDEWVSVNRDIRDCAFQADLKFDMSHGAGGFPRALARIAGTTNNKDLEHPITVSDEVVHYEFYTRPELVETIAECREGLSEHKLPDAAASKRKPLITELPIFGEGEAAKSAMDELIALEKPPLDEVLSVCGMLDAACSASEIVRYDLRLDIVSVCGAIEEGRSAAHRIGRAEREAYDPSKIDKMWNDIIVERAHQPHSCKTIMQHAGDHAKGRPELCQSCKWFDDSPNRNPVVATMMARAETEIDALAQSNASAATSLDTVTDAYAVTRDRLDTFATNGILRSFNGSTLPERYRVNLNNNTTEVRVNIKDSEGKWTEAWETLVEPAVFPVRFGRATAGTQSSVDAILAFLYIHRDSVTYLEASTRGSTNSMFTSQACSVNLSHNLRRNGKHAIDNFVSEWGACYRNQPRVSAPRTEFGYIRDRYTGQIKSFTNYTYTLDAASGGVMSSPLDEAVLEVAHATGGHMGTPQEWTDITNEFLDRYATDAQKLQMLTAFAAPLIPFMNGIDSLLFSVWGSSQAGKTTGQRIAHSVVGKPTTGNIPGQSTWLAMAELISRMGATPCYIDEVTTMEPEHRMAMIHAITTGEARQRLLDGGARISRHRKFTTIVSTTSNTPIKNLLKASSEADMGMLNRIIEIEHPPASTNSWDKEGVRQIMDRYSSHYGTAWLPYMQHVLSISADKHAERLSMLVEEEIARMDKEHLSGPVSTRFITAFTAICHYAEQLCYESGVIGDGKLANAATSCADDSHRAVVVTAEDGAIPDSELERMVELYKGAFTIRTAQGRVCGSSNVPGMPSTMGMIDMEHHVVYISVTALAAFVSGPVPGLVAPFEIARTLLTRNILCYGKKDPKHWPIHEKLKLVNTTAMSLRTMEEARLTTRRIIAEDRSSPVRCFAIINHNITRSGLYVVGEST